MKQLFILLIQFYRKCISPLMGPHCRFTPTCSQYALQAFQRYSWPKALWLTVRRIARCNPWGGRGYDPLP